MRQGPAETPGLFRWGGADAGGIHLGLADPLRHRERHRAGPGAPRPRLGGDVCAADRGATRAQTLHERWRSRDALLAQLSAPHSSFLVAADGEGALVGHAFASGQRAPILAVVRRHAAVTHQGRGIGRRLLAELLARHPRAERVRRYVLEGNSGSVAFYRTQGFSIAGEGEEEDVRSLRLERSLP